MTKLIAGLLGFVVIFAILNGAAMMGLSLPCGIILPSVAAGVIAALVVG